MNGIILGNALTGVVVDGVWYSNESYIERKVKTTTYYPTIYDWSDGIPSWWESYEDDAAMYEYYDAFLTQDGVYEFPDGECPSIEVGDSSYCEMCAKYEKCYGKDSYEDLNDREFDIPWEAEYRTII